MNSPLLNDASCEPDSNVVPRKPGAPPVNAAVAQSARPPSVWKPVITRVVLSGLALVGLAGVGAASMLAGLDGARANSPKPADSHVVTDADNRAPSVNTVSKAVTFAGGTSSSGPADSGAALLPSCSGRTADGRVVLNLATVADLRTLPGIGEKRANAIVALRDKLKRFRKIQELRRVRGIGGKTLQRLAPKLLVDPPEGTCSN